MTIASSGVMSGSARKRVGSPIGSVGWSPSSRRAMLHTPKLSASRL
ncbi:MAG: hypothetical protein U0703_28815 [Anaerolineae bacterium]